MLRIFFIILFNITLIIAQVIITSKTKSKAGLIIPIFNTVGAVLFSLFISPFSTSTVRVVDGVSVAGETINIASFLFTFIPLLLLFMIPAIVNFILYFNARKRVDDKSINDLDKMKIDDM